MKSFAVISALATLASAGPILGSRTIQKRAAITEACDIGYASGTTGGAGGVTTTVGSLAEFTAVAEAEEPAVIVVDGTITGAYRVRVKSNKSIIGTPGSTFDNVGLYVNKAENVIIRNLKFTNVEASVGDAIGIQKATKVWVDHVDVSSNLDSGKDFYDGLIDITHASDLITISNSFIHDHFKASLIGHSDSNAAEDSANTLHVTYANNYWKNTNSRNPSIRFGTAHIFNQVYENCATSGVNTRMGAKVLVESSSFSNVKKPIVSQDSKTEGTANIKDLIGADLGAVKEGDFTTVPYQYELLGSANVAAVTRTAGQTLTFDGSVSAPAPAPEQPVESTPVEQPSPVESSPAEESAPVADDEEFEETCTRTRVKKAKKSFIAKMLRL
ncbi:pectate lyase [Plectosphaerella plurivora]|uniref:pectate lyase n=1 Tax=Plectosphaerella plurivora TaxID=936078 RepID=A0A9P8V0U5_9PEZI|nr:pectate lyase [Plectosphaerella plurivora]